MSSSVAAELAENRARGFLGHISKPLPPAVVPPKPIRVAWDQTSQVLTSSQQKEAWALKTLQRKQQAGEALSEVQLAMLARLAPGAAAVASSPAAVAAAVAAAPRLVVVKSGGGGGGKGGGGKGGGGKGGGGKGGSGGGYRHGGGKRGGRRG
jgi:hypothetical protein